VKLRSHLLVVSLATLLPMALFAVAGGLLLAKREREAFERGAIERVRALMTAVDAELRGSAVTLEALAVLPLLDGPDLEGFRPYAARIASNQGWINLVVTRPSGEHLLNLLVPPGKPIPPSFDQATVLRAVQTGRTVVGNVISGAVLQRPIFTMRTPVLREGEVKYVLSAVFDPSSMKQLLERQAFPDDWLAAVIDGEYRFVARTKSAPSEREEASQSLRAALMTGREGWLAGQTLEGVEAYRAFARSSFSDWSVSMAVPRSVVNRAGREANLLFGLGLLLAMGAGVALALLVARRISAPIVSLAAAAPRLGHGELSVAPPATSVDEIRELGSALQSAGVAIREREAALRAADRAKDEFLAMLGHELRNPLATLTTAAELLRVARDQREVLDNAQALIARQAAHMARLVNDLLEVGHVTGGKINLEKAPVDLADIARRVAASWQSTGRLARHRFQESLESAWIMADAARIEQIVSNLLDNAVKYTPAGRQIALRVRHASSLALLEVSDEGQGLAPELTERVFDLFVQGERGLAREQGGLGIGLTLVKRLAELHGGSASASSAGVGRGSTFSVTFPIAESPALPVKVSAASIERRRYRVLVVDDNADVCTSLAALLAVLGHDVSTAKDGAEALEVFAAEAPEAALIDIGLPDISGYEVARRFRERDEGRTLLIALTGYGRQHDRDASMKAGFNAHLTKPASLAELERLFARGPGGSAAGAVIDQRALRARR